MLRFRNGLTVAGILGCVMLSACDSPHSTAEAASTNSPRPAQTTETSRGGTAIVILDMSKSFAPFDAQKLSAVRAVTDGLYEALTKSWSSGSVYVTTIGSSSLRAEGPCGPPVVYKQQLLHSAIGQSRGTSITSSEVLTKWFQECLGLIQKRSTRVEMYTDISGAVAIAAQAIKDIEGPKLLCVVSDFVEDLPPGNQRAEFTLSGERVLMLWAPEQADSSDPNHMFMRIREWEDRFRKSGASHVMSVPIMGFTAESTHRWIQ